MASSSKNIKMPLVFAISVGGLFALVASVVFGIAWYAYQDKVTLRKQVLSEPTHPADYLRYEQEQLNTLEENGLGDAMQDVVADYAEEEG
ncbi:MAG: hypothetical protein AAGC44_03880 [Planctomycetota bacterium]